MFYIVITPSLFSNYHSQLYCSHLRIHFTTLNGSPLPGRRFYRHVGVSHSAERRFYCHKRRFTALNGVFITHNGVCITQNGVFITQNGVYQLSVNYTGVAATCTA